MMILVVGCSGSGKSALAEKLCLETGDETRIYLATMQVLDAEGKKRVQRHRAMRGDKGFVTIEKEMHVDELPAEIADPMHTTVLLECVTNLVGNELYDENSRARFPDLQTDEGEERFADEVAQEIGRLSAGVHHLIAVTNRYPAEDPAYDEETRKFVRLLDLVNGRLERMAERVEDVCSGGREGEML
ncbi:MAG: bifunctional adenosylcobinamide kinase/adenosylcobinamide-phosphate guanylyltransferase [Lachnospiraceae bacterium]|nr:bifunctional adenosylcobinamide kinase/adenosylcobinamide-phosphate guanylyltransferase [Lachnospiraceae bacterium]